MIEAEKQTIRRAGHRYVTYKIGERHQLERAHAEVLRTGPEYWGRYDNPFERKWTWPDKRHLPQQVESLIRQLETTWLHEARHIFGIETLRADLDRHYAGVFKYDAGDKLDVHVDAGICPTNGMRKHVTAVLYLGEIGQGGELEFWEGSACTRKRGPHDAPDINVAQVIRAIKPDNGTLVFFENTDYAWHGVANYPSGPPRVVLTVSYLSDEVDAFDNKRQRAFFVPRPGDVWDVETYRLRDRRADPERYKEVYRA